jgi:thioesterase domain-containing protein
LTLLDIDDGGNVALLHDGGTPSTRFNIAERDAFARRVAGLSPGKRRLLERLLAERGDPADRGEAAGGAPPVLPLVALQRGGARPPLVCAHPVAGVASPYYPLGVRLGGEQPCYGLQAPGVAGEAPPLGRIEAMAACYVAALRRLRPGGPYWLGGWSFGAWVAFEMACQLAAAGEPPAVLLLFDSPAPGHRDWRRHARLAWSVGRHIWAYLPGLAAGGGGRAGIAALAAARPLGAVFAANRRAAASYLPGVYGGRATLLRCAAGAPRGGDPTLGWRALCRGGVAVEPVPGNHMTLLLPPHVGAVAQCVRRCLEAAAAPGDVGAVGSGGSGGSGGGGTQRAPAALEDRVE